jgi:hypothetical protein
MGGLLGTNNGIIINNSYSTANVSGTHMLGGLVGNSPTKITNSYATGEVSGSLYGVGGIVGGFNTMSVSYTFGENLIALNKSISVEKYRISTNAYVPVYTVGRILGVTEVGLGGVGGANRVNPVAFSCYAYSGMTVNSETVTSVESDLDIKPTPPRSLGGTTMSEPYYYTFDGADYTGDIISLARDTLDWDPDVWNFNTSERDYKLPILKSLTGTPNQDNLTTPEHLETAPLI